MSADPTQNMVQQTALIVSSFIGHNAVSPSQLPQLIGDVHTALSKLGVPDEVVAKQEPAIPLRSIVRPESIGCLECGHRFKSLKRHLRTHHELAPETYREKWGLPPSSPMVAPDYSAKRSTLAKQNGLGRKR